MNVCFTANVQYSSCMVLIRYEDFWTRSEDERRQQLITELELVSPVTDQEIINNSSLLLVDVINSFDEVSFPNSYLSS